MKPEAKEEGKASQATGRVSDLPRPQTLARRSLPSHPVTDVSAMNDALHACFTGDVAPPPCSAENFALHACSADDGTPPPCSLLHAMPLCML